MKTKAYSVRRYVPVWLDPNDQRRLEAKAIARGCSRNQLAEELIQHGLGYPGVAKTNGRNQRETIASLADRTDDFSVKDAQEATGLKRAATCHHLREMVRAGLLRERVIPESSGNEKRYRTTKP